LLNNVPRIRSGSLHLHAEEGRPCTLASLDQQRQSERRQQQQLSFMHAQPRGSIRTSKRLEQPERARRAPKLTKAMAPGRLAGSANPPLGRPGPRPRRPTSDSPRSCTQLQFAHARRRRRPSSKVQGSKATRAAASRTQSGRGLSARVSGKAELLEPLRVKSSLAAGIPPLWYPRRPDQTLFSFFSSRKRSESDQSPVTHPPRAQTRLSASPHRTTKDGSVRE